MTYEALIYDIEKSLKQNYDEKDISRYAILYWIIVYAKPLKRKQFEADLKLNNQLDDRFLNIFDKIPVYGSPQPANPKALQALKYVFLPQSVMSLTNNRGISYFAYSGYDPDCGGPEFAMATFTRTEPREVRRLYMRRSETEKPSPRNVYYFRRSDDIVYFLGIEDVNVKYLQVGLYVDVDLSNIASIKQEIDLPSDAIASLRNQLLGMGRFIMMLPADYKNDGSSDLPGRSMNAMGIQPRQPQPEQASQDPQQQ